MDSKTTFSPTTNSTNPTTNSTNPTNPTKFRNYSDANEKIRSVYRHNHENQTVDFVNTMIDRYCTKFDICKMTIWQAINRLDSIIDDSDPDTSQSQIIHAFQTAENLRSKFPNDDWLHLVGLIHDLGKVLLLPEFGSNTQWSVVGDTYPVGCKFSNNIIFHNMFENNPDNSNPLYNTKLGIYTKSCGLDNVKFSFGHDEYMYNVLIHNKSKIPSIGHKIIRYHSFYPWHKDGAYKYLESESDAEIKKWCVVLSNSDLYTKSTKPIDIESLKPYYQKLVDKYFDQVELEW